MPSPVIGQPAPDFTRPATGGDVTLSKLRGQHVVLYFYPKDNTPGCSTEGADFRDAYADFQAAGALILGVSRDSLASHERFKQKLGLPFELVSDEEETLCTLYDVLKMKNMYGRQVMGIERSTFLIDREGVLRAEWRKVKVAGHCAAVLERVRTL